MTDFKAAALYVGSLVVGVVNDHLQTIGLAMNIIYIAFQIYRTHQSSKNNEEK